MVKAAGFAARCTAEAILRLAERPKDHVFVVPFSVIRVPSWSVLFHVLLFIHMFFYSVIVLSLANHCHGHMETHGEMHCRAIRSLLLKTGREKLISLRAASVKFVMVKPMLMCENLVFRSCKYCASRVGSSYFFLLS